MYSADCEHYSLLSSLLLLDAVIHVVVLLMSLDTAPHVEFVPTGTYTLVIV
jgi:hypothetical protein